MAKPWAGAGAWAADSELAESQQRLEDSAFPSLGAAASSKPKKKQNTVSLSEFTSGKYVGPGGRSRGLSDSKGLTAEDMMMLPTGPRDRSDEDVQPFSGLGGGFKDYGAYRGGRDNDDRDREGGFGGNRGGFEGDRDRGDEPSRADGNNDWGASKKFAPPSGGQQRLEDDRRRVSRSSDRDLPSKADEDDHWGSSKKVVAAPYGNDRRGSGRYEEPSTRGGFHDSYGSSKADDVDNWGSSKKLPPSVGFDSSQRGKDFGSGRDRDSGADADKWSRKEPSRAAPFERPRLVLQPRTRPLESSPPPASREGIENASPLTEEQKASPPKRSTNPFGDALPREHVLAGKDGVPDPLLVTDGPLEAAPKPRRMNPFGEAKPREVILEEKGMDWKTFNADLDRRSADRAETEEEQVLKEEIKALQEAIKSGEAETKGTASEAPAGGEDNQTLPDLREQLASKERELEQLTGALNDKIRFSRVGGERPASRSGNRESERESDTWTKSNGNGQPQAERKGGRW